MDMTAFFQISLITLLIMGGFTLFIGICRLISKILVKSGASIPGFLSDER